jgi:hypothetical protein
MRCSVAGRSTVAGTTVRGIASVYSTATQGFRLVECGVFNTTTTAVAVSLVFFTNATGVGTGLTEVEWDQGLNPAPSMTAFAGHTADSAVTAPVRQATLGGVAGSGVIWTFGETPGLVVPLGTANGIGIICPTGTGQILDFYYDWVE